MTQQHPHSTIINRVYMQLTKTSEGGTGINPVPPSSKFLFLYASYSSSARALASAITAASIWPGSCS